ncbi:MAG: hypothetical protein JO089_08525 [Alphaproteobacteria bacterium]|nr:hypothetical protein [Alphaproteobacteria bacterium]
MKNIGGIFLSLMLGAVTPAALADDPDERVELPQVSKHPAAVHGKVSVAPESKIRPPCEGDAENEDFQKEVLSNPTISDLARARALTGGGGNTAVIVQSGNSNRSSITQSGDNNYASQTQTGNMNDIYVEQRGKHNCSQEKQTGNYNHKVKIQNGNKEETTIDQVGGGDASAKP